MGKLSLVTYPDLILKEVMPPIDWNAYNSEELKGHVDQMLEIMYKHKGIGLAANQAGWRARVIVVNLSGDPNNKAEEVVIINPEIKEISTNCVVGQEGCLSFPGIQAKIMRPDRVVIEYTNLDGMGCEWDAEGLAAKCLQHELDHLNGITFVY